MSQTTTGFHLGARAGFQISRQGLPAWFLIGLVLLFLPSIWVHEAVFGSWVGLRAAAAAGAHECRPRTGMNAPADSWGQEDSA